MRHYALPVATVLLLSIALWPQDKKADNAAVSGTTDDLVRLSYDNTAFLPGDKLLHMCATFSLEGDYQIERLSNDGQMQRLQGRLTDEQLAQLKKLISDSDFRLLSGSHGGIVRETSESFGAEIFHDHSSSGAQHLQWLDPDGESPFPGPVAKVVDWLKRLDPRDGRPFGQAEFSHICPSVGVRLLQPLTAANSHP